MDGRVKRVLAWVKTTWLSEVWVTRHPKCLLFRSGHALYRELNACGCLKCPIAYRVTHVQKPEVAVAGIRLSVTVLFGTSVTP